jgi:predicted amidohydrolase
MNGPFTVSCIQFTSARDYEPNIRVVSDLVRRARDGGADFVMTPENTGFTEPVGKLRREKARDEANHPVLAALREVAQETGVWLLIGSLAVDLSREPATAESDRRLANRSYLIDPGGAVVARYDKIHMFDVDLAGGESYRESNAFRPGGRAVLAETPWGILGMTVCYDLRFPHLYRALAQAGADFLAIPSAFTVPTGKAHWHVLLRSRAIENGCFVFAPAQWGEHAEGRRTYGHSLIVDPWGEVLGDAGEGVGIVSARIDVAAIAKARRMVPSLQHDRPFTKPELAARPLAAE